MFATNGTLGSPSQSLSSEYTLELQKMNNTKTSLKRAFISGPACIYKLNITLKVLKRSYY